MSDKTKSMRINTMDLFCHEDYFLVYSIVQTGNVPGTLTQRWLKKNNLNQIDTFDRLRKEKSCSRQMIINAMAFLAKGDLFGAEDIPKAERFLAFWKCRGGCEYAEFGAYEGVVQAFPEDAYDCHIFDLEKECYQKLMEQYAFAVKERDKPLERNCFDLGHGADNSWKERMRMDGDIIIVDPCYLDKPLDESTAPKLEDTANIQT